jgi:hypothetical protein
VQLPDEDLPLLAWDDPTLQPEPTVAYLMTDTLWALKALHPYDPDLADTMQQALLSVGWYGNALADTLFHGVPEPAHRPVSTDPVHGTYLDSCVVHAEGAASTQRVQLRVPEVEVDVDWTAGSSAQFIDSAVYTALNELWNGDGDAARAHIRDVIQDSRSSGSDTMFWDSERRMLVDQASRCDYDSFTGLCSPQCLTCTPCDLASCRFYTASAKLGLLLYAARAMRLDSEPALAEPLAAMAARLWEGQRADGGIPHEIFYGSDGSLVEQGGATGEATAIVVLAYSLLPQ